MNDQREDIEAMYLVDDIVEAFLAGRDPCSSEVIKAKEYGLSVSELKGYARYIQGSEEGESQD